MPRVQVPANGWRPRGYQLPAWSAWERGIKRSLLIWHRRAGKDELSLNKACVAAHTRVANYWHCLPMYEQARKAIWEAINPHSGRRRIDECFPKELRARTDNSAMTIEFKTGSIWRVVGSDNPDSLVGAPPAGIVFSEWALANPSAWGYLAPILAENNGWADFITTPRGRNHVKSMLDMARENPSEWFSEVLTPTQTGFSLELIETQRTEYHAIFGVDAGDALIEQEYWCSFEAAVLGSYYGREMLTLEQTGHIRDLEIDEYAPVHTAWDLGVGDTNVLWFFQMIGGNVHVVDYYEGTGYAIDHYAKVKKERGYTYGVDFVPHDAKQRSFEADSGADGKAKQRLAVMLECDLKPEVVPDHRIDDGISAVRQTLPRCYFDRVRCAKGLEALREYRKEWDDKKKAFKDTPLHNWASHPADGFRYLAMSWRKAAVVSAPLPGRILQIGPQPPDTQVTLEDLWKHRKQQTSRSARI